MRDTLRRNGFPDAFVVAFEEGSRESHSQEALKKSTELTDSLMQYSREIKIGVLVLLGGVLLVLGVNYLKGFNPLGNGREFHAVYDRIDGLAVSNPVVVNGFKVGQVSNIDFDARTASGALMSPSSSSSPTSS